MINPQTVYKLEKVVDDPAFEGFALFDAPSILGREELLDDLSPAYGVDENEKVWTQPILASSWKAPKVTGRVQKFNDYPCINLIYPVFSKKACDALSDLLLPNGELLPLRFRGGDYYAYNITRIVDVLDRKKSKCLWYDPPNAVMEVDYYSFDAKRLGEVPIFRYLEEPMSVFVSQQFVDRVRQHDLKGLTLTKVWPLPRGVSWKSRI